MQVFKKKRIINKYLKINKKYIRFVPFEVFGGDIDGGLFLV